LTVEPGVTSLGLDDESFPDIPVCVMWGDNIPDNARTLSQKDIALARKIAVRRPKVTVDVLPEHGIDGNGHMLMRENNSHELADRAISWFKGLQI
jgi:hypothetical protein